MGIQALGAVTIAVWTIITISITFLIIKKFYGLRVSTEEVIGLDASEHGMTSGSYADFIPVANADLQVLGAGFKEKIPVIPVAPEVAVPVTDMSTGTKITKVTMITKQNRFEALKDALDHIGITGITVTYVLGYGIQRGNQTYRGVPLESQCCPRFRSI